MARINIGKDVFTAAYDRMYELYKSGHTVVSSFSGGKDSTVTLEICIMAARAAGKLPVNVLMQEEEISYPGTYEFAEQTAARPEVSMRWLVMCQPMVNIFNRTNPYWWVMDPLLDPEQWVRQPPAFAEWTEDRAIETMVSTARYGLPMPPRNHVWDWDNHTDFPKLINVMGLRVAESAKRALGLASTGGYMTMNPTGVGAYGCRPIYDWKDSDVWRFIRDNKLNYSSTYDTFHRMGIPRRSLRVGPPTMTLAGIDCLKVASKAWPRWFDKVCTRVPGIRTAVQFGRRACSPNRRLGETWRECFYRECLSDTTPAWIRERSQKMMDNVLSVHGHHSTTPYPDVMPCLQCGVTQSWKVLVTLMWNGDPYGLYTIGTLGMVEPEFFRPGAGTWFGAVEKQYGRKLGMVEAAT